MNANLRIAAANDLTRAAGMLAQGDDAGSVNREMRRIEREYNLRDTLDRLFGGDADADMKRARAMVRKLTVTDTPVRRETAIRFITLAVDLLRG